jgi:hypothetical protein
LEAKPSYIESYIFYESQVSIEREYTFFGRQTDADQHSQAFWVLWKEFMDTQFKTMQATAGDPAGVSVNSLEGIARRRHEMSDHYFQESVLIVYMLAFPGSGIPIEQYCVTRRR